MHPTCLPLIQVGWPQQCHVPVDLCADAVICPEKHGLSRGSGSTQQNSVFSWKTGTEFMENNPLSLASFHYLSSRPDLGPRPFLRLYRQKVGENHDRRAWALLGHDSSPPQDPQKEAPFPAPSPERQMPSCWVIFVPFRCRVNIDSLWEQQSLE